MTGVALDVPGLKELVVGWGRAEGGAALSMRIVWMKALALADAGAGAGVGVGDFSPVEGAV